MEHTDMITGMLVNTPDGPGKINAIGLKYSYVQLPGPDDNPTILYYIREYPNTSITRAEPDKKWIYFDDSRGRPLLDNPIWATIEDAKLMVRNAGRTPHVKSENDRECVITCY